SHTADVVGSGKGHCAAVGRQQQMAENRAARVSAHLCRRGGGLGEVFSGGADIQANSSSSLFATIGMGSHTIASAWHWSQRRVTLTLSCSSACGPSCAPQAGHVSPRTISTLLKFWTTPDVSFSITLLKVVSPRLPAAGRATVNAGTLLTVTRVK